MLKKISKSFLEKEQKNWLGASEIPVLFGYGYITKEQLFQKKLGLFKEAPNMKMKIGLALEDTIFDEIKSRSDELATNFVRNDYEIGFFDDNLKLCAIPDFVDDISNPQYIGEIKTSTNLDVNKPYYQYQIQTQLMLSGAKCGFLVFYCFGEEDIRIDLVYPDEIIQNEIKEKAKEFWEEFEEYKLNGNIKPIEKSDKSEKLVKEADEITYKAYLRYCKLSLVKKKIEEEMNMLKEAVISTIEGNDILTYQNKVIVSKVERKNETIDKEKLKLYLKEKYNDFVNSSLTVYYKIKE